MGTKLTPVIGLENRKLLMMSSTLWRHQVCILQTRYRKIVLVCKLHVWWRYNVDHLINHLLLSSPVSGLSFNLMPLVEPKLFNFVIFDILVCKIQEAGGRINDTIFVGQLSRAITGVNFRFIPCLVLEILGGGCTPPPKKDLAWSRPKRLKGLKRHYQGLYSLRLEWFINTSSITP